MAEKGTGEFCSDSPTIPLSRLFCSSTNLEGRHEITILLSGKTGTGKSHLTNALIGEKLAEEGEELDPQTDDVTSYDFTKNNVKITVFDTPGLADGTGNDERYLRQILEKVKTVDLFLFCTDMTCKRFSDDDARTIAKLTKTFGTSLWDHALVVFTFANQFNLDASEKDHTDVHLVQQRISCFQKRMQSFQEKIQNSLLSEGVSQDAASNLPFAPAGELKEPRLPDRENWLTGLWIAAFKCISRNAKAHFLMANLDRISISCGGLLSEYENTAETDRTRRGGEREGSKENGIDQDKFWSEGLKRSSPVISTSEGKHWKHFREKLKTIKCKTLTLTAGENNNNDTLHGHQDVNEPKRGSLKRRTRSLPRSNAATKTLTGIHG